MKRQESDKKMTRIMRGAIQPDLVWLRKAILKKYFSEAKESKIVKSGTWEINNILGRLTYAQNWLSGVIECNKNIGECMGKRQA